MGFFTAYKPSVYPAKPFPGFPDSSPVGGFSIRDAGALIWAAQLAYEVDQPLKLEKILAGWGWKLSEMLDPGQPGMPKGFIAAFGETTIVSFAGTEPNSIRDWKRNFSIEATRDGAHEGYSKAAEAVQPQLKTSLRKRSGSIYVTGHSLGGGIAVVATHQYFQRQPDDLARLRAIYTIGMPRAGNAAFAAAYNSLFGQRTFRLIHGKDLVPTVPPPALPGMEFRHVGRLLRFPRNGTIDPAQLTPVPPTDEEQIFGNPLPYVATGAFPAEHMLARLGVAILSGPLRDHMSDQYLRGAGAL